MRDFERGNRMPVFPANVILCVLLCWGLGPALAEPGTDLVAAVGGNVTFPLTDPGTPESVIWFHGNSTLVTIQPATATNESDTIIVTKSVNKPRVHITPGNYSLTLSNLTSTDSGNYSVQLHTGDSEQPQTSTFRLRVYGNLSQPVVTLGPQSLINGTCVTNLTCFLERGGEDVTYSWKSLGNNSTVSQNGTTLPIIWRLEEKDVTFICMARNPVSSNSSDPFSARGLCEGLAGDLNSSISLWISLPLIVLILVLIALSMWRLRRDELHRQHVTGLDSE